MNQTREQRRVETEITERNVPQPQHGPVTETTRQLEAQLAKVQREFEEFNRKLAQGEKGELKMEKTGLI